MKVTTSIFSCPTRSSFLDPKLHDFEFESRPSDYRGDGAGFLKLAFEGIGEIDFIVGQSLTAPGVTKQTVEGEGVDLETVAEVITKKVHYRGASIKPRDIFDIAAASRTNRDAVVEALRTYKDDVARTLGTIERLNPDFVNITISELTIKDKFKAVADTALSDAVTLLRAV